MGWDPTPIADITGPKGDTGEQGIQGEPGADGKTVLSGTGAPSAATGIEGDFYIDTSVWDIYGPKTSGAWGSATSLVGPQGENAPDAVTSISAADGTITIGGTATAVTVAVDEIAQTQVTGLGAALDAKADDAAVVHLTGAETVAGVKTFSSAPVVPVGAAAGNPVRRDDSRLTDARTPLDHNSTHFTGGSDEITPSDIGAADETHEHSAADITSGTLAAARLPLVTTPPVALAYAATLLVDATDGDYQRCALTGGVTGWSFLGGADGQKLLVRLTASASQTVDLSALTKLDFIGDSITVDSDSPAYVGFICDGTNSWTCISAGAVG